MDEITAVSIPVPASGPRESLPGSHQSRATLTLFSGPNAGAIHLLVGAETLIGRGRECAIQIHDPRISRMHARVTQGAPGTYVIEDLDTSNGTFVRGTRITKQLLSEGDRIRIGTAVEFRFGFADDMEVTMLRRLFESSVRDPLTGAYNRKHFSDRLVAEIAYATRHKTPLSVLLFDLDHFKRVNDSFGHLGGDQALRSVATLVTRMLRKEDLLARYGGEEFAIIARGIDEERAYALAERIRTGIDTARLEFDRKPIAVTVSIGVASFACCGAGASLDDLIRKADERLYAAKHAGRNRTIGAVARSGSRGVQS